MPHTVHCAEHQEFQTRGAAALGATAKVIASSRSTPRRREIDEIVDLSTHWHTTSMLFAAYMM